MLTKAYGRSGKVCRVTFKLPPQVQARSAAICGDFNDWDPQRGFMERAQEGGFVLSLLLHPGRHYRFRYLLDGKRWEVDSEADGFDPSHCVGCDTSVLIL